MDTTQQEKRRLNAGDDHGLALTRRFAKTETYSPIRKLFLDVLIEIFGHAMLADDEEFSDKNWDTVSPNNIAAVCYQWREIALASPKLWATFRFTKQMGFEWKHVNNYLHRAKQVPLDVRIDGLYHGADREKQHKFLIDNHSRIRSGDIKFDEFYVFNVKPMPQPPLVLSNLPLLEVLRLEFHQKRASFCIDLAGAPRLRHLQVLGYVTWQIHAELTLHNLVHVDLQVYNLYPGSDILSTQDCLAILRASPNIEVFRAVGVVQSTAVNHSWYAVQDNSHACLPRLSTLEIFESNSSSIRDILAWFRLPALKELTLGLSTQGDRQNLGLDSFLSGSNPMLDKFRFEGLQVAQIVQFLKSLPELRRIVISEYRCGFIASEKDELFRLLSLDRGTQLCPKIEYIEFDGCINLEHSAGGVISLISSRWNSPSVGNERHLTSVMFRKCEGWKRLSRRLQALCEEGLEMTVIRYCMDSEDTEIPG